MFDRNKKSVVLLIVGVFWLGYIAISASQFYLNVREMTDLKISERQEALSFVQDNYTSLLITENFHVLKERLEKSRELHLIDFYIVQRDQEVLMWYNNFNNLDGINVDYQNFNVLMQNDQLAFRTIKIQDLKFTVGVFQNKDSIMAHTAWLMRSFIIRDVVLVTTVLAIIVYLFLKDIISLSKILSSRSREDINKIKTTSAEAQALLTASKGLEGERVRLTKVNEVFGNTIGPAIKYELDRGKPAPYTFTATMCRVDLNGYTQIFMEKDDKYLNDILNRYFDRARAVIERYNGLIYQFVGDEIVFQFKDDMSPDLSTESLAAACIRDLFEEARVIESNLPPEAGHYFKLKGSFAKGLMRFTRLDEGHALSGLPLIESVRLLSLIDEKSHQVMTFFDEARTQTEGLAFIFDRKQNLLKGFKEQSMICRSRDFNSIEWVFESNEWQRLAYFRSDDHLLFILKKVRLMAVTKRDDDIVRILSSLKSFKFASTSPEVVKEVDLVLAHFAHSEGEGLLGTISLSAVVTLLGRVIPKAQFTKTMETTLVKLLDHLDSRVQANAILVLGQYGYPARKIWEKMYSYDNRVAADTIVEVAKQQLNEDLMRAIDRLLTSSYPQNRKSGEYALNKILSYYKESDPVFYSANPYMQKLRDKKTAA